jgi:hypothetical protein
VIDYLLEMNPRTIRKLLEIAFGFAHAAGLSELSIEDIKKADHLLSGEATAAGAMGFI